LIKLHVLLFVSLKLSVFSYLLAMGHISKGMGIFVHFHSRCF